MTRGDEDRVDDILDAIADCQRFAPYLDSLEPDIADMAATAIERNVQIIGEAAANLSTTITHAHPEIEWPAIRGMRIILVHKYFGVNWSIVKDVIESKLPPLAEALRGHTSE